jgi:hypothetical protein
MTVVVTLTSVRTFCPCNDQTDPTILYAWWLTQEVNMVAGCKVIHEVENWGEHRLTLLREDLSVVRSGETVKWSEIASLETIDEQFIAVTGFHQGGALVPGRIYSVQEWKRA